MTTVSLSSFFVSLSSLSPFYIIFSTNDPVNFSFDKSIKGWYNSLSWLLLVLKLWKWSEEEGEKVEREKKVDEKSEEKSEENMFNY